MDRKNLSPQRHRGTEMFFAVPVHGFNNKRNAGLCASVFLWLRVGVSASGALRAELEVI